MKAILVNKSGFNLTKYILCKIFNVGLKLDLFTFKIAEFAMQILSSRIIGTTIPRSVFIKKCGQVLPTLHFFIY